jgi:hypothetical protein
MKYEQIFIKSEADLPKDGTYIAHSKIYDKVGSWEMRNYENNNFPDYCKMQWLHNLDWYLLPIAEGEPDTRKKSESELDLMQYVTNLLYDALEQGFKLRHFTGIGEGFRNADTTEFDKWVEEQTELLAQYYQFKLLPLLSTDEEIEERLKYEHIPMGINFKEGMIEGAKWMRSQLQGKETIK